MELSFTTFSKIELGKNKDGKKIIKFKKGDKPVVDYNVDVPSWVDWVSAVTGVAVALAGLAAGTFAEVALDSTVLAIIAAVVTVVVDVSITAINLIIKDMAEGKEDDLPAVSMPLINMTNPIKWTDSGDFLITSASFNGALQFGGDPGFVDGAIQ